jgi:Kef-type K+ transport system membrane component KefB
MDMLASSSTETTTLILLFGGLIAVSILIKSVADRVGLPAMVGFLLLGLLVRWLHDAGHIFGQTGMEILEFLGKIGVVVLLFRVGLESNPSGLKKQLRCASIIWVGNVVGSSVLGYVAARYLLDAALIPSLLVAVAMTATSVGIPSQMWREQNALDSEQGERFLDVAELDDISGVIFMGLLFSVLPALQNVAGAGGDRDLWMPLLRETGLYGLKFILFAAGCFLFSQYLEKRFTQSLRKLEQPPEPMLVVVGVGMIVAAVAGLLGFSAAIGAFLAGLVFSRDPKRVKLDSNFTPLYDLFMPFFFISVGLMIPPEILQRAWLPGLILLLMAILGKLLGTSPPAMAFTPWRGALVLGVSMIPRAEIMLLISQRGVSMGKWALPHELYAAMVFSAGLTCILAPVSLRILLKRWPPQK